MKRLFLLVILFAAACSSGTAATPVGGPVFVDTPECQSIAERLIEEPLRELRIGLLTTGVATLLTAEVADDQGSRSRGLMCRSEVPPGAGMIFQFGGPTSGSFWMFNTYVPLDILYFDQSGRVVGTASMSPCPKDGDESEGHWRERCLDDAVGYGPGAVYASALELPADWLRAQGLRLEALPGDLRLVEFGPVSP